MNNLLYTISGRNKLYKFLEFSTKFLTSSDNSPNSQTLCWTIKQISKYIGIARHINKFGSAFHHIQNLKQKLNNKLIFSLSLNELFSISSDLLSILDAFVDHLIFLCKIDIINKNNLNTLNKISGIIWFLTICQSLGGPIKSYYNNNLLSLKEKSSIIRSIFEYILLINTSSSENLIPSWLSGIFGMVSNAIDIYNKYLLK